MKIYTKKEIKVLENPTGYAIWFMHDTDTDQSLCICNYDMLFTRLPYTIHGTSKENCFDKDNFIIDEMEFHEVYDKVIDSLNNFIP